MLTLSLPASQLFSYNFAHCYVMQKNKLFMRIDDYINHISAFCGKGTQANTRVYIPLNDIEDINPFQFGSEFPLVALGR